MIEHPKSAESIPDGAWVVMQVERDKGLNEWSRTLALRQVQKDQKIVYVNIKKKGPVYSRIIVKNL